MTMHYIIYSNVPSASVFVLSAIVSVYVSDSLVWIYLNCLLPAFSYLINRLDSMLAEDNIYNHGITISNNSMKMDCWIVSVFSMCYSLAWYSWYLIPICIAYNTVCEATNNAGTCTTVSMGYAVLKLSYKIWIAIPMTYLGWTKYEERKTVEVDSPEHKRLTWELHSIIAALLIFASYSV